MYIADIQRLEVLDHFGHIPACTMQDHHGFTGCKQGGCKFRMEDDINLVLPASKGNADLVPHCRIFPPDYSFCDIIELRKPAQIRGIPVVEYVVIIPVQPQQFPGYVLRINTDSTLLVECTQHDSNLHNPVIPPFLSLSETSINQQPQSLPWKNLNIIGIQLVYLKILIRITQHEPVGQTRWRLHRPGIPFPVNI